MVEIAGRIAGGWTYSGMESESHRNTGLTAAEWLSVKRELRRATARERCRSRYTELPPCGPRKYDRDRFVVQATQARFAREVEEQISRISVNHTVSNRLGLLRSSGLVSVKLSRRLRSRPISPTSFSLS